MDNKEPTYGTTKSGHRVHGATHDYLFEGAGFFSRLNAKIGLKVTLTVGTMWTAYLFSIITLFALPSAIHQGTYFIIVWLSSSFLQLVLLPIIIVGQNIQSRASDARSSKTFEDTEKILDRMDIHTEGGLKDLAEHFNLVIDDLKKQLQAQNKP